MTCLGTYGIKDEQIIFIHVFTFSYLLCIYLTRILAGLQCSIVPLYPTCAMLCFAMLRYAMLCLPRGRGLIRSWEKASHYIITPCNCVQEIVAKREKEFTTAWSRRPSHQSEAICITPCGTKGRWHLLYSSLVGSILLRRRILDPTLGTRQICKVGINSIHECNTINGCFTGV